MLSLRHPLHRVLILAASLSACVVPGVGDVACNNDSECPSGAYCGAGNRCSPGADPDAGPAVSDAGP